MIIDFNQYIKEHDFQMLAQKQRDIIPITRNLKAKEYLKSRAKAYDINLREYHDEIEFPMLSDLLNEWKTLRGINGAINNDWSDLQNCCHSVLLKKAKEYAKAEKRLHNFIECQDIYGGTLGSQVIDIRKKHLISIFDILDEQDKTNTIDFLDEKFGDYVNYTLLLFYADSYEYYKANRDEPLDAVETVITEPSNLEEELLLRYLKPSVESNPHTVFKTFGYVVAFLESKSFVGRINRRGLVQALHKLGYEVALGTEENKKVRGYYVEILLSEE